MGLKKIGFLAWMVGRSLFAGDAHVAAFKGFECESRFGGHFEDTITRVRFERVGERFQLSYVPSHTVAHGQVDTVAAQVLGSDFGIGWLPEEDPRILRSVSPGKVFSTRLVKTSEPGCCGHYLSVHEEIQVTIQTDQTIRESFHPSFCKLIQ